MFRLIKNYYYKKWKLICLQLVIFVAMWGISALYEWQGRWFTGSFKGYQIMLSASFVSVIWLYDDWKRNCSAFVKINNCFRSIGWYLLPVIIEFLAVYLIEPSYVIMNAFFGCIAYSILATALFYVTLVFTGKERMALFLSLAFVFCEWLFFGIDKEAFDILSLFAGNKYQYPQDLFFWFGKCILIGILLYCCTLGKWKISVSRKNDN